MRALWVIPLLALAGGTLTSATSWATPPSSNNIEVAQNTTGPAQATSDLEAAVAKTNVYVSLLNRSSRGIDSWNRYKSWVDIKKGVTGKERYISYGLYNLYDDVIKKHAPKAREAAETMQPKMPTLDQATLEFIKTLEVLHPLVAEASAYYDRQDYKDDNFAKAKELHPKLVAAFEAFVTARAKFDAELTVVKADLDEKTLAEIERTEGKKYNWHKKRTMMSASRTMDLVNTDKPDVARVEAAVTAFADIVRAYDDYVRSGAQDADDDSLNSAPASILSSLRDYRDALKKKDMQSAAQALNSAISSYNTMVTFAN